MTNELKGVVRDALKLRAPNGPITPEVVFPSITCGTHTNFPQNRDQKNFTPTDTLHLHHETGWSSSNQIKFHMVQRLSHRLSFQASYTYLRFFQTMSDPVDQTNI